MTELIRRTDLSEVGVLRALLARAEVRALAAPEHAFIECTRVHAESHAAEIERRLRVRCVALATTELSQDALPASIRNLVTTAFHRVEVQAFARRRRLKVIEAPIEYPEELAARLAQRPEVVFLGINETVIEHIASDISAHGKTRRTSMSHEEVATTDLDRKLQLLLGTAAEAKRRFIVLSPSLWEAIPARWQTYDALVPGLPKIQECGWPTLGQALGVSV